MDAVLAVESIARLLEEKLVNFHSEGEEGVERNIRVYRYCLPDAVTARTGSDSVNPEDFEGLVPAIVVTPISWEDTALEDGASLLSIVILVCVFAGDPENADGPRAVLNILERMRRILLVERLVGEMFEIQSPLSWQLLDGETKPLWFGEMTTQWRILAPFRVEGWDWRGDRAVE